MKIPSSRPVDMSALSESELDTELEKGYTDIKDGRTRDAKKVFWTSVKITIYDLQY